MKILYLLVADHARAKLYKVACPPSQLTLIYHQVNFVGPLPEMERVASAGKTEQGLPVPLAEDEDFGRSLCRVLKSDYQAHRFETLVVVTTRDFLAVIRRHLDGEFNNLLTGIVVPVPAQLGEPELVALLQNMLAQQAAVAIAGLGPALMAGGS